MNLRRCYTADFETTTDEDDCRVWAYSICNVDNPEEFIYGTSIDEFFEFCSYPKANYKIWFHNLKFDSNYLLNYLFSHGFTWIEDRKDKADKTFTTLITDMGQFYSLVVYFKIKGHHTNKVEFFDSMKIFPNFSVERIAQSFNLPIRKLKIDYRAYRPVGHKLTQEEIDYIRNDVEIVARALKEMFIRGLTRMTIASDALTYFKDHFVGFRKKFPLLPKEVDADIRKSYRGGFTYVNDVWAGKIVGKGITLDVNSLYPSCMSSPYELPYGEPVRFEGKYEDDIVYPLYVQCLSCSFDLKPGKIPSIQIRNSLSFMANEYVKSSNSEDIELMLTKPDLELFLDQYEIHDPIYCGGWKFKGAVGMFDDYVNHWMEEKIRAGREGNAPLKTIAKTMLNSLYGKLALASNARQNIPYFDEGVVRFYKGKEEERETLYIPVAAFITAYGRNKTIRTSQAIKDYTTEKYGEDRYYYSDTDSISASITPDDLEELKKVIQIDKFKLGYWDWETSFDKALFLRQKAYIKLIDGKVAVTVAGLPKYLAPLINFDNFKKGFTTAGMTLDDMRELARKNGATEEEIEKLQHKLTYKYVKGGVILADTDFTIV